MTSANGARELGARRDGAPASVAAIGPGDGGGARGAGSAADVVADVHTQEGLLAEFPRPARAARSSSVREGARGLLVDELGADFLPAYRTVELTPAPPDRTPISRCCVSRRRPAPARELAAERTGDLDRAPDDGRRARGAASTVVARSADAGLSPALVDSAAAWRASSRS